MESLYWIVNTFWQQGLRAVYPNRAGTEARIKNAKLQKMRAMTFWGVHQNDRLGGGSS